jgi:MFS family permease
MLLLGSAAAGLVLAALDAYAVVTLLPRMMADVDLPIDRVEAAAPIVSGFLGGYVVAMPLLGALSDDRGRPLAYAVSMVAFGLGSTLTALAPDLAWLVAGRALQGLGGGALVPLSLALAADLFPAGRRLLAVAGVSALQEAGSVVGPVYGAAVAQWLGGWRPVFWLNLPLGALVLAGMWMARRRMGGPGARHSGTGRGVDWSAALLLGLGLGLLVVALYPDDPAQRPVNRSFLPLAAAAALALVGFGWTQRRRLRSLAAPGASAGRKVGFALLANLLAGVGLMVALVDVPLLASGVFGLDSLAAGLLLIRFLAAVPAGALVGGWLAGRTGGPRAAASGLWLSAAAFVLMSTWSATQLRTAGVAATFELLVAGFGFGLIIAPLSAAVLDLAEDRERGRASGLVVLARTLGMVIGLSSLTAFGLARFQELVVARACGLHGVGRGLQQSIAAYEGCLRGALLEEYQEIFVAAAMVCAAGALAAQLGLGRRAPG